MNYTIVMENKAVVPKQSTVKLSSARTGKATSAAPHYLLLIGYDWY